jgi:hypothetical protein
MHVHFTHSFQVWHNIGLPRYDTQNGRVLEEMWSMNTVHSETVRIWWCLRIVCDIRESLFACVQRTAASFIYIAEGSNLTECYAVSNGEKRFWKILVPLLWESKSLDSSWAAWPWRWRRYESSKSRYIFTCQNGETFHRIWIFSSTAASTRSLQSPILFVKLEADTMLLK